MFKYSRPTPPGFVVSADLNNDGLYDYYAHQNWWIHTNITKRLLMQILYLDIEMGEFACNRDVLMVSPYRQASNSR